MSQMRTITEATAKAARKRGSPVRATIAQRSPLPATPRCRPSQTRAARTRAMGGACPRTPYFGNGFAVASAAGSDVEAEQHHVAIADDIVLAFHAHLAGFLGADLALAG